MHVAELSPGSELSITVLAGNKKVVFATKVVEVDLDSKTLVIEEIKNYDGKPLSFASPNISINMTSINENKLPIIWKGVTITHFAWNVTPHTVFTPLTSPSSTSSSQTVSCQMCRLGMFSKISRHAQINFPRSH